MTTDKVAVAVAGATGYTGIELVRLLQQHPYVRLQLLTSQSYVGQPLPQVYPHLLPYVGETCREQEIERLLEADVVFLALPHGHAAPVAEAAVVAGRRVIDLGADLRLDDPETYQKWYKAEPPPLRLVQQAVYGLPELYRSQVRHASLIANPGCFPTSILLALAPAVREGLIASGGIIIDSKSGVSGAGRGLSLATLYCEVDEGLHPYNVARHRHTPEIEQELTKLAGREVRVTFTPHLAPMSRGILSTVYAQLAPGVEYAAVRRVYEDTYNDEPFVHLLPAGTWPHTKWVYGSNHCLLAMEMDQRTGQLIIASAIDNLVKGASGQAVQNLNLMFGWDETSGLKAAPLFP